VTVIPDPAEGVDVFTIAKFSKVHPSEVTVMALPVVDDDVIRVTYVAEFAADALSGPFDPPQPRRVTGRSIVTPAEKSYAVEAVGRS
jgi:hypothetical protein